jgi:drug/metabolite transporter (DMT)-like permease
VRPIPTQLHAAVDVTVGALLVALPWIANFDDARALAGICVGAGAAVLVLGWLTDYETSAVKLIPMPVHLAADVVVSFFLIGTAAGVLTADAGARAWVPLLAIGIAGSLVAALSDREPRGAAAYGT